MLKHLSMVILAFAAVSLPVRADDWDKKFDLDGPAQLNVRAGDGHVDVRTWDQKQISAHVTTKGWRIADDQLKILATQTGNRVDLEIVLPHRHFMINTGRRTIQVDVTVPRDTTLGVHTSDGNINVTSLAANADLETSDGHVTVTDLRGDARIESSDGRIEVSGMDGKLTAKTSDGRINVRGRFDELNLRTSDGSIVAEVLPGSKITTDWSLSTSDGNLELRLPETINADLDARSGDGRIISDVPITVSGEIGRSNLHGRLNSGGPVIQLKTQDGNIRISRS